MTSFLDSSSVQKTNQGFDFCSWCFQIEEKKIIFWKDEYLSVGTKCEHVDFKENENEIILLLY